MDRMDFIQAVSRTRVLETRLLTRAIIERMIDSRDLDEAIKILGETEYANVIGGLPRVEEYEKILSSELKRVYKLMYEMVKDRTVVDLLALKYDYHNLKVLIKEKLLQKDFYNLYIPIGTLDIYKLRENYLAGNMKEIDDEVTSILEAVISDFEINKDPQRIDILLDKHYITHLYDLARKTEIPLFINYVEDLIDFTNIRTLIRVKKQNKDINFLEEVLLPNGKIKTDEIILALNDSLDSIMNKFKNYRISPEIRKGLEAYRESDRLSEFEKEMDNYIMNLNKPSKSIHFGPEPIFSYIVAKETEIKILRIIMVSKLNNIAPDNIRERLRDLYV